MRRSLATAVLVVVPLVQVQGQSPATRSKATWLTLGLGRSTWAGGLAQLGGQATASHQTGRIVVSGRAVMGFDVLVLFPTPGTIIAVQDFGLMLGYGTRPGFIHYSMGAGIGVATVTRSWTSNTEVSTSAVGFPLEAQVFIQPLRFFGVGLYGYGDLNKERSFWGWSISVAVGRLR